MELKVWVEGIQRIVCGVTEKTTCQDVVYALAHATGKTGRFTLIERWRNNERLLAPQEHPLKVLQKWGEYSDVQFILQRSALEGPPKAQQQQQQQQHPHPHSSASTSQLPNAFQRGNKTQPNAVWKPPPQNGLGPPLKPNGENQQPMNARLSPDSGRGSDKTGGGGSDTSNSYSENEAVAAASRRMQQQHPKSVSTGALTQNFQYPLSSLASNGMVGARYHPPAYRGPPPPGSFPAAGYVAARPANSASPASGEFPPPYRNPPPAPSNRQTNPYGYHQPQLVRRPHYSPPPTHRSTHLSRHPSRTSLVGGSNGSAQSAGVNARMNQHGLPSRQHAHMQSSRVPKQPQPHSSDLSDLVMLVSQQQATLYSQQSDIKQFDAESQFLEHRQQSSNSPSPYPASSTNSSLSTYSSGSTLQDANGHQIDVVLSEVQRLEEVARRNDEELGTLRVVQQPASNGPKTDDDSGLIKSEISQLRQRLAGTDQELQKTNNTLKRLGDEMRSMSAEKTRQRETELNQEIERLQGEIKMMQRTSEEGANVSQRLSREVKEVEEKISARKAEVEKLIKQMRDANMESLAISPPEESKDFLDAYLRQVAGPSKPGSTRQMTGSPRELGTAVPTPKNPHGVWV